MSSKEPFITIPNVIHIVKNNNITVHILHDSRETTINKYVGHRASFRSLFSFSKVMEYCTFVKCKY